MLEVSALLHLPFVLVLHHHRLSLLSLLVVQLCFDDVLRSTLGLLDLLPRFHLLRLEQSDTICQ